MLRGSMLFGLAVLGLALLVGASDSQEKKGKAKGQLPPGWKDLTDLTAAQKEKIYSIQDEYKGKISELQKKIKELQTQERKDMVNVLTESQRTELQQKAIGESKKKDAPKDKAPEKDKKSDK